MAEQTTPHGSDIELLINLTKDVAVLSEAFKSFKAERSADNDSLKEEMREMKADMKEMKSDIIALKAEPGKQAKTRQDKVIDYVLLGILGYIGVLLTTYVIPILGGK